MHSTLTNCHHRKITGRAPLEGPFAPPVEGVRIECVQTMTVTEEEARAWHGMLRYTGLRAADVMRRAVRILLLLSEAHRRGARILVREADGSETQIVLV